MLAVEADDNEVVTFRPKAREVDPTIFGIQKEIFVIVITVAGGRIVGLNLQTAFLIVIVYFCYKNVH